MKKHKILHLKMKDVGGNFQTNVAKGQWVLYLVDFMIFTPQLQKTKFRNHLSF